MSAPDTNALPPAPVTTTTRTSSSPAKSSRMRLAASHISRETALWRSGLLKIMVPTRPSLRASILSVAVMRRLLAGSMGIEVGILQNAREPPSLFQPLIGCAGFPLPAQLQPGRALHQRGVRAATHRRRRSGLPLTLTFSPQAARLSGE